MLFSPSILLSRLTFYSSTSSYPRAGERDQSKAGKRAEQSNIRDHSSPVSSSDSSCFLFYSPLPLHPIFWREQSCKNVIWTDMKRRGMDDDFTRGTSRICISPSLEGTSDSSSLSSLFESVAGQEKQETRDQDKHIERRREWNMVFFPDLIPLLI